MGASTASAAAGIAASEKAAPHSMLMQTQIITRRASALASSNSSTGMMAQMRPMTRALKTARRMARSESDVGFGRASLARRLR